MFRSDHLTIPRQDDGPLDDVLQFTDIAWPIVAGEDAQCSGGEPFVDTFREVVILDEVSGQCRDVFTPFT